MSHGTLAKIRRRHLGISVINPIKPFQCLNFPSLSVIMNGKATKTCVRYETIQIHFRTHFGVLSIYVNHLSITHSPYFNEKKPFSFIRFNT